MKNELFADLLASAEEMVEIEKGRKAPADAAVHRYETLNVKAIREASGKDRREFAVLIGASYESVKSWENRRRNPAGTTQKLLKLISQNPPEMVKILESA